ncbi:MAG: nucleotidyltransferase domain-containing protein [Deltaproteobacteria bacterium]|nr:nucleotidyltransferase domain-containing protein [Deltaproteobacteria bacterium]
MTLDGDCAIWLYGSHARGDADSLSDVDVLVVSNRDMDPEALPSVVASPSRLSITRYAWREIEGMAEYGSLFLRHIQLEGCALREGTAVRGRMVNLLSTLPRYSLAGRDLKGFQTVLADVRASLDSEVHLTFELATLATLFRHACILGCAVCGSPCFSRFGPIAQLVRQWGLSSTWSDEFPALYAYRLYASGRSQRPGKPSREMARLWCDRAAILLAELEVRVHDWS